MSETQIKKKIKDLVVARGGYYAPIPQGAIGSKAGDPDMVICYKGRFIGMEGKTGVGKQRELQKTRQRQILAAGGYYLIGRSAEEVAELMDTIDKESEAGHD